MRRLLTLCVVALALQSCSLARLGVSYQPPIYDQQNPSYGHHTPGYDGYDPVYEFHNSTYGYDLPVSPVHIAPNLDKQPAWGPAGFECAAFYYMPELNIYYDVNSSLFYYQSGSSWIAAQYLPPSYRSCDLYRTYKVVLNYSSPWQHNAHHRSQFRHYRDDRSQVTIRMTYDPRYNNSYDNTRPWVDPNRRSNRKSDYNKEYKHDYKRDHMHNQNGRGNHNR